MSAAPIILDDCAPPWATKAPVTPPARVQHDLAPGTEVPPIAPGSDDWFLTVSASKIAAIMGTSPWESPYSTWHKMAGLVPRGEQTTAMARGHYLEPAVAAWFRDQHPEWIIRPSGSWVAAANERFTATPDRLIVKPEHDGAVDLLQIKSTTKGHEWGAPGSADIPVDYLAQVQWEMHVVGASRCHVAIIGAFLDFAEYVVDYDPAHVARLTAEADRFLALLDARTPPSIDTHGATFDTVRALHPDVDDDASVDLDEATVRAYVGAIAAEKAAKDVLTGAKVAVLDAMGDAKAARWEGVTVATRRPARAGATPSLYPAKSLPVFDEAATEAAPVAEVVTDLVELGVVEVTGEQTVEVVEPTPATEELEPVNDGLTIEARTAEVRERIAAVKIAHPGEIGNVWPEGITPKGPWTLGGLALIGDALHALDGRGSWLPPEDPDAVAARDAKMASGVAKAWPEPTPPAPPWLVEDDTALVDDAGRDALVAAIAALPKVAAQRVDAWRAEGKRHGRRWGNVNAGKLTERTFALVLAAVRCADDLWDDDDPDALTRAALTVVIGEDVQPSWATGAVIGSLTVDQALALDEIAAAFGTGDATTTRQLGEAVTRVA